MVIHRLSQDVIAKIAAGEVVERPASVVKELVENALDAQATAIQVVIQGAGKEVILVSDNGVGMEERDALLAVERHATSKLSTENDLFQIRTLGFRGEALAAIGAVSRMTVTTHAQCDATGLCVTLEGGTVVRTEPVGVSVGTTIRVENLFYNIPARLKFLKQDSTERQQIEMLMARMAIAYPEIRFELHEGSKELLRTHGTGKMREAYSQVYGLENGRQLLEVLFDDGAFKVEGLISPVALTRSNRREITFFVNGRWIQDMLLNKALLQAYQTLIMVGRFPIAFLKISMPPQDVDVNVHPAKAEVRFRESDRLFALTQRAVRRTLLAQSGLPSLSVPTWHREEIPGQVDPSWDLAHPHDADRNPWIDSPPAAAGSQAPLPGGNLPLLRLIGQIGATYLIAEGPDGIYLIDQHAAHERVLYERFLSFPQAGIPAQGIIPSLTFELPLTQARLLGEQVVLLQRLGFQLEVFGGNAFRLSAMPAFLVGSDPLSALRSVVEDFEEDETPLQAELEKRLIARICKRAAIKAGQVLTVEEQRALLESLEAAKSPRTCPHGRPTMIHLSVELLERQFGRRGAVKKPTTKQTSQVSKTCEVCFVNLIPHPGAPG